MQKHIDILEYRAYNKLTFSIFENDGGVKMPRVKFRTLTEQMFYVLLCLKNECYGMDILDKIPAMTNNRVAIGSGTLYNLLEQFLEADMIIETKIEGRKRSYLLTEKGKAMLDTEYARIVAQAQDYRTILGGEKT